MVYTLRAIQRSFYSGQETAQIAAQTFDPITLPERVGAVVLLALTVVIGLFPNLLLDVIKQGFQSPLMSTLLKGE